MTAPLDPQALLQRFRTVRDESLRRTAPLSAEDCQVQSMADASPASDLVMLRFIAHPPPN